MLSLLLFFLFFSQAFSNYIELESENLKMFVHKDIVLKDIDKDCVDKIYNHVSSFLDFQSEKKFEIYVTIHDVAIEESPLKHSRDKNPESIIRINFSNDFDILDVNSFDFIFCYELAKQLIKAKVKSEMQYSLEFVDYVYSVRNKLYALFFHDWLVKGIALKIAKDYSTSSIKNIERMKSFATKAASGIENSEMKNARYPIAAREVFTHLREDDFHLKFLFVDFLDYIGKIDHKRMKRSVVEILSDVKRSSPFSRNPMKVFEKYFNKNIFRIWWSSIRKSNLEYELTEKYEYKYNLKNDMYHLSKKDGKTNIMKGSKVIKRNVSHFDVYNNDLYYTSKQVDMNNDKFRFHLYKNKNLLAKDVTERFFVTKKGICFVENLGLRDRVYVNGEEIVSSNHGIKVQNVIFSEGRFLISGAKENSSSKIYDVTRGLELCEGHSLISYNGDAFFVSNDNKRVYKIDLKTNRKQLIFKCNNIEEISFNEGSLVIKYPELKGYELKTVQQSYLGDEALENRFIDLEKLECSHLLGEKDSHLMIYPDFNILGLDFTLGLHYLKGSLLRSRIFDTSFLWDVKETIFENKFNIKSVSNIRYPIMVSRELYFVPGIEIAAALSEGPEDNNVKLLLEMKASDYSLQFYPRVGIRGEDLGKLGFSTYLNSSLYLHHHYGDIGEESKLPEFKYYKIVDLKEDKVAKEKAREGTSYLVLGLRKKFERNINLTIEPYKLKVKNLGINFFAYALKDFVVEDSQIFAGGTFDFDIKLYGWDVILSLLVVFKQNVLDLTEKMPKTSVAFNYEINF